MKYSQRTNNALYQIESVWLPHIRGIINNNSSDIKHLKFCLERFQLNLNMIKKDIDERNFYEPMPG